MGRGLGGPRRRSPYPKVMDIRTAAAALTLLLIGASPALPAPHGSVGELAKPLLAAHPGLSGLLVLERGEDSILARSWLIDHASRTIDAQYFIWTADNIGILASEALLRAADRGVRIRVIVDDLMVEAPTEELLFLAAHPNVRIKIYNPNLNLGTGALSRLWNSLTGFRSVNQRMHDKTFIVDRFAGITGGRNVADEYFDFDHEYNFRDREMLALGPAARAMDESFELFWESSLSVPIERLLEDGSPAITPKRFEELAKELHDYAGDPENFSPEIRRAVQDIPKRFPEIVRSLVWDRARFVSDAPGKNPGVQRLEGGGRTTRVLFDLVSRAKKRVTIQSPYCVLTPKALDLLAGKVREGVEVRVVTNSLAASDNLKATSGYLKQRGKLLLAGLRIHEFRPDPEVRRRLMAETRPASAEPPIFAIHAKTLVVDGNTLFVGTFNLDPRSANLNTEVGLLVEDAGLASQVEKAIEEDMAPENSWKAGTADGQAPWGHRIKARLWGLLPLDPLL